MSHKHFVIKNIGINIMPYKEPSGQRQYHLGMFAVRGKCVVKPVTVDYQQMEGCLHSCLKTGELYKAYLFYWVIGKTNPNLVTAYPWWGPFLAYHSTLKCMCGKDLGQDRAMSRHCVHQLCTHCAVTLHRNSAEGNVRCPICGWKAIYLLFNGQQCDDDRSHPDLL